MTIIAHIAVDLINNTQHNLSLFLHFRTLLKIVLVISFFVLFNVFISSIICSVSSILLKFVFLIDFKTFVHMSLGSIYNFVYSVVYLIKLGFG